MCSIHSISRYNDFVLDLQDSSEVHSYQPVMNKVVSCKDSSGTIINDIHLLKLSFDFRMLQPRRLASPLTDRDSDPGCSCHCRGANSGSGWLQL